MPTTLVYQGANHLRYLITGNPAAPVTITTTGGATPDLVTDSVAGPIKNMANAFVNGYGKIPAGALTQAQARAIWLSDDAGMATVGGVPHGRITVTPRTGAGLDPVVDADVDGGGHPTIVISEASLGAFALYVDVEVVAVGA